MQIARPKRDDGVAQTAESAPVATPPSNPPDILSVAQLEQYLWSAADILRGSIDTKTAETLYTSFDYCIVLERDRSGEPRELRK